MHLLARALGFAAFALAAPALVAAQSTSGRVVEAGTRRPLGGIAVTLLDSARRVAAEARTSDSGVFYLDAPVPGRYSLAFARAGGVVDTVPPRELRAGDEVQVEYVLPRDTVPRCLAPAGTYCERGVERPVVPAPGNPPPRYPKFEQETRRGGEVLAQFVVDTAGRPVMSTFRVLRSSGMAFEQAVRDVLPRYRFIPAFTKGHRVAQLVQLPFTFQVRAELIVTPPQPGLPPWWRGGSSPPP